MVYSSRTRSASVSTEPFTRATGLPTTVSGDIDGPGAGVCVWVGAWVKSVGAWEATWAVAAEMASKKNPQIEILHFMINILDSKKKGGRLSSPSPVMHLV